MKMLDYVAAGIPVVSTATGAEGMPIEPGVLAAIANSPEEFAQAITDGRGDSLLWQTMSQAGRQFVRNLGWRSIA
jgi:glycosyltransferase involved in cell wall biosynthesis